jgi:hypothetical protein
MKKRLAVNLIQLTQDACLKAFWRKRALRLFLKQHRISDKKLATWHQDESKREFIDRLVEDLLNLKENKGHSVIEEMANSLAEMKHFPDLENWEDSAEKISVAHKAVARLKVEVDKLNQQARDEEEIQRRRKVAQEKQEKTIGAQQTLEKLGQKLNSLSAKQGTQEGGYDFEKWFYELVSFFELPARPPYNANGRQIDGSLTLDGTTFLIETKFTKDQSGAPDIDIFMSKIVRKADNTMGIFVSMSGFSGVAIDEASRDRTPMLLMDYSHIYNLILPGIMSFPDVIRRIKRHASQAGRAYLAIEDFSG